MSINEQATTGAEAHTDSALNAALKGRSSTVVQAFVLVQAFVAVHAFVVVQAFVVVHAFGISYTRL